jgi:demethylmenaquinone methyltransferase / 2-methoxy-6-polyprenyl-1,4-benzoquinol methylase
VQTSGEVLAREFFPGTGRSYDRVVRWTTLGRDAAWKRKVLSLLPPSRSILELACGTGILTVQLLDRNPGARLVGVDLTDDYLAVLREKVRDRAGDFQFVLGDAATTPVVDKGPFDAVVSCYVPKYVDAETLVANVTPALAPGAVAIFHDFSRPHRLHSRVVWRLWFGVLNLFAPLFHPEWKKVFDKRLTRLIAESTWTTDFRRAFDRHGYVSVHILRLTFGAASIVFARRPGERRPAR